MTRATHILVNLAFLSTIVIFSQPLHGQSIQATSPRSIGMGGCMTTTYDEHAAQSNPAGVGLFHLDHYLGASIPLNSKWVSNLFDDAGYYSLCFSAGVSTDILGEGPVDEPKFAIGAAYSRRTFDWGQFPYYGEEGEPLGMGRTIEEFDCITLGLASDYFVKAGVGYSFVNYELKEKLQSEAEWNTLPWGDHSMYDYGILVEIPIVEIANRVRGVSDSDNSTYSFELTPAVSFVRRNNGWEQYDYPFEITGVSSLFAVKENKHLLVSVRPAYEHDRQLNTYRMLREYGVELNILDIGFLRAGRLEIKDGYGASDTKTSGFGVSLGGAIRLLTRYGIITPKDATTAFILNRVDVRLEYADYSGGPDGLLTGTSNLQLMISL